MRKLLLIVLIGIGCYRGVNAQILVDVLQVPQGEINISNPVSIRINNTQPDVLNGFIKLSYSENGKPLYECYYQATTLQPGIQTINTDLLAVSNQSFSDASVQSSGVISSGNILFCIEFINSYDNVAWGSQCKNIFLGQKDTVSKEKKRKVKLPASFTGYAEISGNYSNRQGSYQDLPANYTNVIINPKMEIFGLPVGARFNYSTAANKNLQNMNLFSIYFDADGLKKNLEKKYITNINQDNILEKGNLNELKKKQEELGKLNSLLSNPVIQDELQKLKQHDSLNRLLQDSSAWWSADKVKEVQQNRDSLSYLEKKRGAYEALFEKQKQLSKAIQIINNPLDTAMLKDSLIKLQQRIEDTKNAFTNDDEKKQAHIDSLLNDPNSGTSKQRREILKNQRDALEAKRKIKEENEQLKEEYSKLYHAYQQKNKIDSLRRIRGGNSTSKDSILNNSKGIKDRLGFLKPVKSFNVGFFAPHSGELTLHGVPLRGAGIDLEFDKMFFSFAGGKLQRNTNVYNNSPSPFSRVLYSATVGIGKQSANFIRFQVIDAKDDEATLIQPDSFTNLGNTTGHNKVLATKFKVSFFKNISIIEGEVAGSQLTKTVSIPIENNSPNAYAANKWITNIFEQGNGNNYRTGYGYNISFTQLLNKNTTLISISSKKVASSYVSFGSPYVLTDIYMNEARATQQFWKGKLTLTGFYRVNADNLEKLKTNTTRNEQKGGDLSLRVPRWPSLRIMYLPIIQQSGNNRFMVDMLTINSVHGIRKSIYYHQFSGMYINQKSKSTTGYNNFTSENYTFNYLLSIKQIINTGLTVTYIQQKTLVNPLQSINTTVTFGHTYKGKVNQQSGILFINSNTGNRQTWFYELSVSLIKNLQGKVRYDRTGYEATGLLYNDKSYIENLLTFSLIKQW